MVLPVTFLLADHCHDYCLIYTLTFIISNSKTDQIKIMKINTIKKTKYTGKNCSHATNPLHI